MHTFVIPVLASAMVFSAGRSEARSMKSYLAEAAAVASAIDADLASSPLAAAELIDTTSPGCRCGDACDCSPCQCGLAESAVAPRSTGNSPEPGDALAMLDPGAPCAGGACEVGGHATAGACGAGGCATAHHSHGVGLRAGQPLRNAGRLGLRAGVGVVRGTARVGAAVVRGSAAVLTVRFRARQNHGGPFPLFRAWRCRRGGCH